MSDETKLPLPTIPAELRARVLDRALAPEPRPSATARALDVALALFCVAHVGWCLHAIGFV